MINRPDQTRLDWQEEFLFKSIQKMQITNISEAKASLSYLIQLVQETNEPVIIGKAGKPVAVLSAFRADESPRMLGGSWEGKVEIAEDFDEADEMLIDSFYNPSIFPDKQ